MKALSIRQPWAWLIVNGHKDVENRSWQTKFRGPVLIHASKTMTDDDYTNAWVHAQDNNVCLPEAKDLERGGIVGQAIIVDCVTQSDSPWFFGPKGLIMEDANPLPFKPCKGMLGFFQVEGGIES